jgi:hypothetical protein
MKSTDTLIRDDGKEFIVVFHGHWSTIRCKDDPTITDCVKWIGGIEEELYVGASSGWGYKVKS